MTALRRYALQTGEYALPTGESDKAHAHVVQLTIYNDMQEVCRSEVCRESLGINHSIDFLHDAKHLRVADKSTFVDILGEATWSHT